MQHQIFPLSNDTPDVRVQGSQLQRDSRYPVRIPLYLRPYPSTRSIKVRLSLPGLSAKVLYYDGRDHQ
jgi:hypothetical protein